MATAAPPTAEAAPRPPDPTPAPAPAPLAAPPPPPDPPGRELRERGPASLASAAPAGASLSAPPAVGPSLRELELRPVARDNGLPAEELPSPVPSPSKARPRARVLRLAAGLARRARRRWRWLAAGAALAVLSAAATHGVAGLQARAAGLVLALQGCGETLQGWGWGGLLLFSAAFLVWRLCMLPLTALEIAGGFLFGFEGGLTAVLLGKTGGSVAAWHLGRRVFRSATQRWVAKYTEGAGVAGSPPAALAGLVHAFREKPVEVTAAIRLFPAVPLAAKEALLSAMPCSFALYMWSGVAVNVPFAILWTHAGSTADSLLDSLEGGDRGRSAATLAATVGATALALVLTGKVVRDIRRGLGGPGSASRATPIKRKRSDLPALPESG